MQHFLNRLTDLTALKGDETTIKQALENLADQAGFDGYAYLHIQPGHMLAVSNYHPEWRSMYFEKKFAVIDPVVKRAKALKRAFAWSCDQDRANASKPERTFYAHAADFGIRSGITIPVRAAHGSMSMSTLASKERCLIVIEKSMPSQLQRPSDNFMLEYHRFRSRRPAPRMARSQRSRISTQRVQRDRRLMVLRTD